MKICILLFALLLMSACVTRTRFRYNYAQPECFSNNIDPLPPNTNETREWRSLDCRSAAFKIAFIEFDEQGKPQDPSQTAKALKLIEDAQKSSPSQKVVTLVYVHGWKNNAAQARPGAPQKDVERFAGALRELAYRARPAIVAGMTSEQIEEANKVKVPIVGVYIGWRGKSLMGPSWFTFPSFWPRRNAANRVGSEDLADSLDAIVKTTNDANENSRVLLIGHSFGARALESAISTNRVTLYDRPRASNAARPRVDLVLYVNSANDSRLALQGIENLRAAPIDLRHPDYEELFCAQVPSDPVCQTYPLLTAITSTGDSDTKYLLPIANTLWPDRRNLKPAPSGGPFADPTPSEIAFARSSAAHQRFFHSHDVDEMKCPATGEPTCDGAPKDCAFAFKTFNEKPTCYRVDRRLPASPAPGQPEREPYNRTPFWIMQVAPTVIADHGDIWNQNFVDMLAAMMAPRGFFDPTKSRMKLYAR